MRVFSREQAREDFERLFAAWPVKKDKLYAMRRFLALARARILPALPVLLDVVDRLKREDAHWQNGYPPKLDCWLGGHGWNDEPFVRPAPARRDAPPMAAGAGADSAAFFQRHAAREEAMRAVPPEIGLRWLHKIRTELGLDKTAADGPGQALGESLGLRMRHIQAFREKFVNAGTACFA